jgi:hypothetical protein
LKNSKIVLDILITFIKANLGIIMLALVNFNLKLRDKLNLSNKLKLVLNHKINFNVKVGGLVNSNKISRAKIKMLIKLSTI